MKLCMMTYTMARQGNFGPEDFVKTAVDCKLDGIDWITTYGRDPKDLKKMSNDVGLKIACHTFFLRKFTDGADNWLDDAKKSVEDAVTLGTSVVMIPTPPLKNETDRDLGRQKWIEALKQVAPLTDDAGLVLTVENFPGKNSPFVTAGDFFEAKKEIPQLKLTYDNGNSSTGEDAVKGFELCKDHVVHVHFKDWYISNIPPEDEGWREMLDGKFYKSALIGEGDVNTKGCWNALRNSGYNGYINIEYESNDIPADKAIKQAADYLRSL